MQHSQLILPTLALGTAAFLLTSAPTEGFALTGDSLSLVQRDFRIFNNFTNPEANDNQTPDPNFPGHVGAVLAIWKGSIEWQSELHGTGDGDPSQPGDLGSGGANFDPSFQGEATDPGDIDANVHSTMPMAGGITSFIELPSSDGWRIRYSSSICFDDGPGVVLSGGCIDIQGVAAHQYGHALGLAHSTVAGATMSSFLTASGVDARSIEADDIAGVQAIYGVAAASKPRITAASEAGGVASITGLNFDPTGNEVWFTQLGAGGLGDPIKVPASSTGGGTFIQVNIPALAGPGDVLVKTAGATNSSLSNAFPFDTGFCTAGTTYCVTSPNSVGPGALIAGAGSASVAANNLVLSASSAPPSQNGIFYFGLGQGQIPFGDGVRCVTGTFFRLPIVATTPGGNAFHTLDLTSPPAAGVITPNTTWNFQFWYRDPVAMGSGFNLSDGLSVLFCP